MELSSSGAVVGVGIALAFVAWTTWTHFIGAIWSPAPMKVVRKMLSMADVGKGDVVYDLGSGDGRIVIEAAKRGASVTGIEIDPLRVMISNILIAVSGQSGKARIECRNLMSKDMDLSDADVVTLYLMQQTNDALKDRLMNELRAGTKVVSYLWTFKDWKPAKVDAKNRVYMYEAKGVRRKSK